MLVVFWAFNNITVYILSIAYYKVPLDYYYYQTTNNFKKLLEQKDAKNIFKLAILILLTIYMHIEPTRLLEVGYFNVKYNSKKNFIKSIHANWGDDNKIKKDIAPNNNENNNKEDFQEKDR